MDWGRNDPCPCGSGLKYKKCCLLKEQDDGAQLAHRRVRRAAEQVPRLLLGHARKIYGAHAWDEAWGSFWDGQEDGEEEDAQSSVFLEVFTPWFMYHWYPEKYDTPEVSYPCEHTVVAQFLRQQGRTVDPVVRGYLEAAQREPLTFWQAEAVEPGRGMLLRDLALDRECFVHDVAGSDGLSKWDLVLGHVVGLDGVHLLSGHGPYPLPAARFRQAVEEFLQPLRAGFSGPESVLGYDVDFLWFYQDCVAELLTPAVPQLTNTDGEELELTTSRYRFAPADRPAVIGRLQAMEELDEGTAHGEEVGFAWVVQRHEGMLRNAVRGSLQVGAEHLVTECNSRAQDQALRERLQETLGGLVVYEDTASKSPEEAGEQTAGDGDGPLDLSKLPEEARAGVVAAMEQIYLRWADGKVPALGNQTPRKAVATEGGRAQVRELINDWENTQLRAPNPQFLFDFNKLRESLGLEPE